MPKEKEDPRKVFKDEEVRKAEEAKAQAQRVPSAAYDGEGSDLDDASSDWDRLSVLARSKFPDNLALKFNLTPAQRRAAIAFSIGWTKEKISQVAGIHVQTVYKWFRKEETQEFIKAFQYHTASRDAREVLDGEIYASIQVLKDLRDDPTVSANTRADISKWFWESKYGKAKESREVKGVSLRDLTEQLRAAQEEALEEDKKEPN